MTQFEVAIVGAGPAGSTAAILLARRGYSVALLDKEEFPREKLCGDFLNPSCRPLFAELGIIEELSLTEHETVTGLRVTCASGAETELPLIGWDGAPVLGLGLRRLFFDRILINQAAAEGVSLLLGGRVNGLSRTPRGWQIAYSRNDTVATLQARILLGADGRNSWVANQLLPRDDSARHGRAIGFQLRLKYRGGLGGKVEIHHFPGGYAGLIGLGDGTLNLCLSADRAQLGQWRHINDLLENGLPRNPFLREILSRSEPIAPMRSAYPVYFPARRPHFDGALLIGDAARVNEPVTGEGVFFAMRSAAIAAATVDQALPYGDVSARRLSVYTLSCDREFRRRRRLNSWIRFLIYRPALLAPLLRISRKNKTLLSPLVQAICTPGITA